MIHLDTKIFVAGHKGLVGSSIVRRLQFEGYSNIITHDRKELDLMNQKDTEKFFHKEQPELVFLCAAKVGGIHSNNTYRAEFIYNNLMIQSNIIHSSHLHGVRKLLFLGSSCFPKGTTIITSNGIKNIEDIKIGDEVLTHINNYKKVYHLTKKEHNNNLLKIELFGWNNLECTLDHEILTENGFIKAENLKVNDVLLIPKSNNEENDIINILNRKYNLLYISYSDFIKNNQTPLNIIKKYNLKNHRNYVNGWGRGNKPIYSHIKNNEIDLKQDLSTLCGYYVAEGWISGKDTGKRGSQHTTMFSPGYNDDFANDIKIKLQNIFGVEPHFKMYPTTYKVGYLSNKLAYDFFKKFYDKYGHKAHNKIIPNFILKSSIESLKLFLKGYWRGDGHYTKRKDRNNGQYLATCASTSKTLIYQLQQILLKFDIFSSVYYHKKNEKGFIGTREVNQKSQWELRITGKYAIDFIKNILDIQLENTYIPDTKYSHYYHIFEKNYVKIKIKKISTCQHNGFVYDLSVEDDNSYTANGIAVHNCIYPRNCPQPIKEEYLLTSELEKTNEPYAIAKIAGLKMCEAYHQQYGSNFYSVMPTNLFGTCFSSDTEVITPSGIKNIKELNIGDDIYTLNPQNHNLEIEKIISTQKTKTNDFYNFKGSSCDFKVTPDHKIYYKTSTVFVKKEARYFEDKMGKEFGQLTLAKNKPLIDGEIFNFKLDDYLDQYHIIDNFKRFVKDGKHSKFKFIPLDYDLLNFCKFLGWYISEGSIVDNMKTKVDKLDCGQIRITQSSIKNKNNYNEIDELLKNMNVNYGKDHRAFYFCSRLFKNFIRKEVGVGSKNKKIPKFIFKLPLIYRQSIFETLMKGDGNSNMTRYNTNSDFLRDDFIHLCLTLGIKTGTVTLEGGVWRIYMKMGASSVKYKNITKEEVNNEDVYCVTTQKNHIIFAGRNKKFNWIGQCDNYNLETSHVLPAMIRKIYLAKLLEEDQLNKIKDNTIDVFHPKMVYKYVIMSDEDIIKKLETIGITRKKGVVTLQLWGTGSPYREFMHVDDCSDACLFLINKINAKDIYDKGISNINIGTGKDQTIEEMAHIIKDIIGFKGHIVWDTTKPDGTPKKQLDVSLINSLGWKSKISLEDGIQKTYEAYIKK